MYEPFPIYDLKTGLDLSKEPWLIPRDAFSEMKNAYLERGVLKKRKGYTQWGRVVHLVEGQETYPGYPVMGIHTFYTDEGSNQLLIFDIKRINRYDPEQGKLIDPIGANSFSGTDADFFWCENWKNRLFITNNVDRIKVWDGSTLTNLDIDFDGDGLNDVATCLLIYVYKGRLILLRPTEKGYHCPHRVRWSVVNSYTNWRESEGGGYIDCPTLDWIIGADFIGDDLIVLFERSIWVLKYTGDYTLPFRWEKIKGVEGCYATYSVAPFSDELIFLGPTNIMATDGMDVYEINQKIPEFTLNFNPLAFKYSYSIVIEELKQSWMTYASMNSEISDKVLLFNYDEGHWSDFNLPFHCFGYFNQQTDLRWDDIESPWDEIEWSWDEKELKAGYPTTLAGDYNGYIWKINDSSADNGNPIELNILSGKWNPYAEKGLKARLGYVDFLVDYDPNIYFYVDFYKEGSTFPYQTKKVICDGNGEKVWKRVYSGAIGKFHRIRIRHNEKNMTLKIHCIIPWFAPAGRMI